MANAPRYVCASRRQCRREDREYADECGFSRVPKRPSVSWCHREPFFCPGVNATVIIVEYKAKRRRTK